MQDGHALATACCSAAQVLHDNQLVHCDLRLPNVVQTGPHHMVVDLERVAGSAAQPLPKVYPSFHNVLKTCTAEVLDKERCFAALSDMFCIGALLKDVVTSCATPFYAQAEDFIQTLLDKDLTAKAVMRWIHVSGSGSRCDCNNCGSNVCPEWCFIQFEVCKPND